MRGIQRYRRAICYKNFVRTEFVTDENNRKKKAIVYTDVKTVYGTVSTPTGNTIPEMFGTDESYDKVVVLDMPNIDISENSVLWLDVPYSADTAHDYIVRRVIRNHNFLTIGVRKVNVTHAETDQVQSDG